MRAPLSAAATFMAFSWGPNTAAPNPNGVSLARATACRPDAAARPLERALGRLDALADAFGGEPPPDLQLARAAAAARLARLRPDPADQLPRLDALLEALGPPATAEDAGLADRLVRVDAQNARARLLAASGPDHAEEARRAATAAVEELEALRQRIPANPEVPHLLAEAVATLARLAPPGPEATALWRRAVELEEAALKPNPARPAYRDRLDTYRAVLDAAPTP